jgi:Hsp20/alpha crystallin family
MATAKKKATEKAQTVPVRGSDKPVEKSAAKTPFATLRDVERLFEDFPERGWPKPFRAGWPQWPDASKLLPQTPAVDVVDREKDNYFHQEIRSGSFSRSVLLPADVDAGKAQATFKDGVLELTLPKRRVAKQQQVPVR